MGGSWVCFPQHWELGRHLGLAQQVLTEGLKGLDVGVGEGLVSEWAGVCVWMLMEAGWGYVHGGEGRCGRGAVSGECVCG